MLLGEVAPELPGLGALVLFLISFALVYVAVPLIRLILGGPRSILGAIPIIGGALKAPIKKIEDRTVKWLANKAAAMQGMGVAMFRVYYHLHRDLIVQLAGLAVDTYHGLHGLDASLKRYIAKYTGRVQTTVPAAKASAKATTVASVALQRRWMRARLRELRDYVDASVARALAHAPSISLRWPRAKIGYLDRVLGGLAAQVRSHAKLLAGAGAAALVGTALRRLGLGFLRCSGFKKAGKRACGIDPNLMDALLLDTLLVAGTLSLVEFAKDVQAITEVSAGWMRWFWKVSPDKPKSLAG